VHAPERFPLDPFCLAGPVGDTRGGRVRIAYPSQPPGTENVVLVMLTVCDKTASGSVAASAELGRLFVEAVLEAAAATSSPVGMIRDLVELDDVDRMVVAPGL
jgi:hypothetical protein